MDCAKKCSAVIQFSLFLLEVFELFVFQEADSMPDFTESAVCIILAQEQAIFSPGGEETIWLLCPAGDKIIY